MRIRYMPHAIKDLRKFPPQVADRIITKMDWYVAQDKPLSFADTLTNSHHGTYRFRIGDYRTFCDVRNEQIEVLEVLSVKKRDHAYDRIT